ncbi:putative DNA-binding transcriptional regulator YafY [Psychromicrobium silvestre]|uniref:Putative DNA-binding transcriptional regulator YafY n=1 Tax=Psychromicrobium silvestre TaxID=1645614 RepID=A0A7Y9LSK0_9MICC|nr:WYL domain-containing protein [Psychromicrobium silvestre]NYE94828.1 putative DNA-binding transcriptional regulator YafY [Psychromicrobium silvestre]
MIETSARLLQLLSLLQVRREWTGSALAERMSVTERTVRRDVDKLRSLGYPIHASPGVAGGYQLGAGADLPPLLLDDDEALAVALGLSTVAVGPVAGIGEASIRALRKLEQVLPPRLRPRFASLQGAVSRIAAPTDAVEPQLLTQISAAISERRVLSLRYQKHDGEASSRLIEPYRLVDSGPRWYLLAWDLQREDWRTFRVDRVQAKPTERQRFLPRALPAKDLAAYVHRAITRSPYRYDLVVRVQAPASLVSEHFSVSTAVLETEAAGITLMRLGWDSLDSPLGRLAASGLDFEILEPAELRERAELMAQRLLKATAPPT